MHDFFHQALCDLLHCRLDCIQHCSGQLEAFTEQCEGINSMLPNCRSELSNMNQRGRSVMLTFECVKLSIMCSRCQLCNQQPEHIDPRVGRVPGGPIERCLQGEVREETRVMVSVCLR